MSANRIAAVFVAGIVKKGRGSFAGVGMPRILRSMRRAREA